MWTRAAPVSGNPGSLIPADSTALAHPRRRGLWAGRHRGGRPGRGSLLGDAGHLGQAGGHVVRDRRGSSPERRAYRLVRAPLTDAPGPWPPVAVLVGALDRPPQR